MLISLGGNDFDLSSVFLIGKLYDDSYSIQFESGLNLTLFEQDMPREKFISIWQVARINRYRKRIEH